MWRRSSIVRSLCLRCLDFCRAPHLSDPCCRPDLKPQILNFARFACSPLHTRLSGGTSFKEVAECIMPEQISKKLGFIGAGQMAEALARGFIAKGVIKADMVHCTDPVLARREVFESFGAKSENSNLDVAKNSEVIFLAVKPQFVSTVLKEIKQHLTDQHIVVSIAAGIPLAVMKDSAGDDKRLVRVMPNTPCLVGETASAMCLGGKANDADGDIVKTLFNAVGTIFKVDEKLLSAVTGLSGSGPAYVFVMIEALADGGVRAGLPRDIAQQLAAQTVLGSAKMVLETGKHPGALKDMVTSPAGTTIAGVHELERCGTRAAFINAVLAATTRADELSKL